MVVFSLMLFEWIFLNDAVSGIAMPSDSQDPCSTASSCSSCCGKTQNFTRNGTDLLMACNWCLGVFLLPDGSESTYRCHGAIELFGSCQGTVILRNACPIPAPSPITTSSPKQTQVFSHKPTSVVSNPKGDGLENNIALSAVGVFVVFLCLVLCTFIVLLKHKAGGFDQLHTGRRHCFRCIPPWWYLCIPPLSFASGAASVAYSAYTLFKLKTDKDTVAEAGQIISVVAAMVAALATLVYALYQMNVAYHRVALGTVMIHSNIDDGLLIAFIADWHCHRTHSRGRTTVPEPSAAAAASSSSSNVTPLISPAVVSEFMADQRRLIVKQRRKLRRLVTLHEFTVKRDDFEIEEGQVM